MVNNARRDAIQLIAKQTIASVRDYLSPVTDHAVMSLFTFHTRQIASALRFFITLDGQVDRSPAAEARWLDCAESVIRGQIAELSRLRRIASLSGGPHRMTLVQ